VTHGLEGRRILVTGGSRGIGRAIVEMALAGGARVACCSRNPDDGTAAPGALHVKADVSREEDVDALFRRAQAELGPLDVVVSNAGISRHALLVSSETSLLEELLATNLSGAFLVARAALGAFRGRGGRLVFVGSIQENGSPRGASAYATSKGGLGALVRSIARDYASDGVQVMQLVTGFVDTELTRDLPDIARARVLEVCPLRRLPSVDEIAALTLYLASDRGSGFNGRTLRASGGMMEMLI